MASIFEIVTEPSVRAAYVNTGAEPAQRVVLGRSFPNIVACPVGVLAYDTDRRLLKIDLETFDAMEIIGVDVDPAAEGFYQGWDSSPRDTNYAWSGDTNAQAEYDRGYEYGEKMRESIWTDWPFSNAGKED